ncbi:MAG: hypothetical protein V4450_01305 [Bacteroidota bacterium]
MKKHVLIILVLLVTTGSLYAQASIKLEEVKLHIGDSVKVCGKVFGGRFLETANGKPTLVNIGGAFPNELLTVVIFGTDRAQFKDKPEEMWLTKTICVTGKLMLYKDKPQIVVTKMEQVSVQ